MSWRWSERVGTALAAMTILLGVGAAGCMGERGAVNRVQPDYIDKEQMIPNQYRALAQGAAPESLNQAMIRAEPQWLHQITILAKPPTTGFSGISTYTQVDRVNFEVTENFLVARQSYDQLRDGHCSENAGCEGQNPRRGEILAVYAIRSHFDIRRSYNAATGEEQNVVEENSSDRPWYQRRYMRVDWSANLVSGFNPLVLAAWSGRLRAEPVAAFYNNPNDPNRPQFDYGEFAGQNNTLRYFDVTNRMVIRPEETSIPGYPSVPACALFGHENEACNPVDVTFRVAFRRVDPTRDFQPLFLDGHSMERFGFFEDGRRGFTAHEGGPSQAARRHIANRHNLWVNHHIRVAANTLDHREGDARCETDRDCNSISMTARCDTASHTCGEVFQRCAPNNSLATPELRREAADLSCGPAGSGATCDVDIAYLRGDRFGLCLLPFRERDVRPIAYHLSPSFPERFGPVTSTIVSEWNRVFSRAVREARYRECLLDNRGAADAGSPAACEHWRDLNMTGRNSERARDARLAWVGCHNPVWGTEMRTDGSTHTAEQMTAAQAQGWGDGTPACGPQGTSARLGDLRYSMLGSVNSYDMQGPWGLAGITGDPITGEVVNGRGMVWSTVTDVQAAYATDMMRILNGDVEPQQFALGQTVVDAYDYIRSLGGREERVRQDRPRTAFRDIENQTELQNLLRATAYDNTNTSGASLTPDVVPNIELGDIMRRASTTSQQVDTSDPRHPRVVNVTVSNDRNVMHSLMGEISRANPPADRPEARRERLRGTSVESRLLDRETLLGAGLNPDQQPVGEALETASPARRNNHAFRQLQAAYRASIEATECAYDSQAFADDVIAVMLRRFRINEVPEDVRFGQTWDFHMPGSPQRCEPTSSGMSDPCRLNWTEIQRYLLQYIQYGVMLHELGHSVGERHNFSGTADALNYPDRYWELRGFAGRNAGEGPVMANAIQPRWVHQANGRPFYGIVEEANGVEEYAYSTVMDYAGWNQDAHGLGRYDQAFVYSGYVGMVEAFRNVTDADAFRNMAEGMNGGYQSAVRLTFIGTPMNPQPTTYHYTDIPRLVGATNVNTSIHDPVSGAASMQMVNVPNIRDTNRYTVFQREAARQPYNPVGWDPDHPNVASRGPAGETGDFQVVPYRFGTDDWANYVWNTQRYDAGADMYESMRHVATRYMDYYFSNAFARGRATFTVNGYRARMTSRYLDQMYYSMRSFLYLDRVYRDFYAAIPAFQAYLNTPTVIAGRLGGTLVLDTFVNALLMPRGSVNFAGSGTHYLVERFDNTEVWDPSRSAGRRLVNPNPVNIPINAGREFASYYDYNGGFWWRENIISAGSFHDKVLASEYLTDTFVWTPGRTVIEFQDAHNLQTNIYTAFPAQTIRFYGSLLSRDHADVAPLIRARVGQEPQVLRTQISLINLPAGTGMNQNGRDTTLRAIDPNLGFSTEINVATDLFANLGATFDRSTQTSARMWREGDTWAIPAATGRTFVNFTDPFTGLTYSAVHQGAGVGEIGSTVGLSNRDRAANETGIAARMLIYANHLLTAYNGATPDTRVVRQRELQGYIDFLNIFRDLNRIFYN